MQLDVRIAVWNANGLSNHRQETEIFLKTNFIDILLISETHFTARTYFTIKGYDLVTANHPDDRAHAGSAILIKSSIKYEVLPEVRYPYLQAAGLKVNTINGDLSIYAVYFPPRHAVLCETYEDFFTNLGSRYIVGGDYNAKHPWWGSRLINPKGRELYKCIRKHHLNTLSSGSPTYWPTDPTKIPDLLDFIVYSGISQNNLDITDSDELNSDHTPIIINYTTSIQTVSKSVQILKNNTDIASFKNIIETNINLKIPISNNQELDNAVEMFTNLVHEAAVLSTPTHQPSRNQPNRVSLTAEVRELIRSKRRLRRIWQLSRHPADKHNFNRATKVLKQKLYELKNRNVGEYLKNLDPNKRDDHSLWNATKYLKRPAKRNIPIRDTNNTWCRSHKSKAEAFSLHLEQTFRPFCSTNPTSDNDIIQFLDSPCQMSRPIKPITSLEVKNEILKLGKGKSPGYDKIDARVTKSLPKKGILFLTLIFNSILRLYHFPTQWKCAEIVMVPKPNKNENDLRSYRPISLLVTFSKLFEKIFLERMKHVLEMYDIIPDYQFGFRNRHGTPEQCHRIVNIITNAMETKKYCSAVFLDVKQAFDKVWHHGLLFKLKSLLPAPFYLVLKSYLHGRSFYVNINQEFSTIRYIQSGVPQGSVLGPTLYTIFTSDMPLTDDVTIATYADDTAIISSKETLSEASYMIQTELDKIQNWLHKWRIQINTEKSAHVTFAMRRGICPPVYLNSTEIPIRDSVKYLGMHLDRRLTWKSHIKAKQQHLNIKTKKMYWLLGSKSELDIENKLLLYKTILKPVWSYGIQLWGTASTSNIEIMQRYQSKTLRAITNAPWFVTNKAIHRDLNMPTLREEINNYSARYLDRISNHPNPLAICLLDESEEVRRLKRYHVLDLPFRN